MGNLSNKVNLIVVEISKGMIHEETMRDFLLNDSDFFENEDEYRDDTLELGFKDEADRVSKEIFEKFKDDEYEDERVHNMVSELWNVRNFFNNCSYYGDSTFRITETDFSYVVSIAFIN